MLGLLATLLSTVRESTRSRLDLLLEIAALRHQIEVLQRSSERPRLRNADRRFWIWLCRHWVHWRSALMSVRPETVLRWHREGYRRYWSRISRGRHGRPPVPRDVIEVIRRISSENPGWGEDRIALEMELKLGIVVSPSTVRRYRVTSPTPTASTWRRFISSHAHQIYAMDFVQVVMWDYSVRHVLAIIALDTRRIVHIAVTGHPTLDWVRQQIRTATPYGLQPRFLLHDNDAIFVQRARLRSPDADSRRFRRYRCRLDRWLDQSLGIRGLPIPNGAPNASPHVERFFRELRQECLDHFLFFSEGQLRRTVREFVDYHNGGRVHQGIRGIPDPDPDALAPPGHTVPVGLIEIEDRPVLGGLIHNYRLAA